MSYDLFARMSWLCSCVSWYSSPTVCQRNGPHHRASEGQRRRHVREDRPHAARDCSHIGRVLPALHDQTRRNTLWWAVFVEGHSVAIAWQHFLKQNVGFAHENTGTSYLRPENLCQLYWNSLRLASENPDTTHYEKKSEKKKKKLIVFTISVSDIVFFRRWKPSA